MITKNKISHTPNVLSIRSITSLAPSGAIAYKILEPSSGGIGKILKTKKPKFIIII